MANIVVVSGQFNSGGTSFIDSPVIIQVSGLSWPTASPFTIVRVEVKYNNAVVGGFRADTGGQTEIKFDISSALRAVWSDYDYSNEVSAAGPSSYTRAYRSVSLELFTEYLSDDGVYTATPSGTFSAGSCAIGGLTELERSLAAGADMSWLENSNLRFGDASTKPLKSLERVGINSITSWVDLGASGTRSCFYPASATMGNDSPGEHAPIVLRDSQPYVDFLFLNRRGAIETCSGMTKEAMGIGVSMTQYSRTDGPSFKPSRSLMAIGADGRRSWQMSSGYVTREWADWWAMDFLSGKRKRWWMLWQGPGMSSPRYVPVIVKPAKNSTDIYDRAKQSMPHVDFTVTLALEG